MSETSQATYHYNLITNQFTARIEVIPIMKFPFIHILLLFLIQNSFAQSKYWVFFKDKESDRYSISGKTIINRKALGIELFQYTDLPINQFYIDGIKKYSAIIVKSRWFNAVTVYLDSNQVNSIINLPFVKEVRPVRQNLYLAGTLMSLPDSNFALPQINSSYLEKEKLNGKGVDIGVIDGRFTNSKENLYLSHLFENKRIAGVKDFVKPSSNDFFSNASNPDDNHGTLVLQLLGGRNKNKKSSYGLAPESSFYLARTDVTEREYRGEEDYWVAAIEWMDSLGVRLINTSLGYSIDFDDPKENYRPEDMNGQSTIISRAAQIATTAKGMIIVVSSGNDGGNFNWQIVAAPADAKDVITVGATDFFSLKHEFSSIGPSFLNYVKPETACFSPGGTSFSAPIITGLIACMLQKKPSLTNQEIKDLIQKSGSLYPFNNNYLGYGVPDSKRLVGLIGNTNYQFNRDITVKGGQDGFEMKYKDKSAQTFTVFHKKNQNIVIKQDVVGPLDHKIFIERLPDVKQSTLVMKDKVVEIIW